MRTVALVTLGCSRNEVDSEELAGRLAADGWTLVADAAEAIWEYLASYSGSHFGLPAKAYAVATLVRIVATIYFLARVSTRSKAPQESEFLISQAGGYA